MLTAVGVFLTCCAAINLYNAVLVGRDNDTFAGVQFALSLLMFLSALITFGVIR